MHHFGKFLLIIELGMGRYLIWPKIRPRKISEIYATDNLSRQHFHMNFAGTLRVKMRNSSALTVLVCFSSASRISNASFSFPC